jgi:hypothetical protein
MPEEFWQILWEKLHFNLKTLENNKLFTWKPTGLFATTDIWNVICSAFIDVMNAMNTNYCVKEANFVVRFIPSFYGT